VFAGSRTGSSGREPGHGAGAGRALAHRCCHQGVAVIESLITGLVVSYIGKMRSDLLAGEGNEQRYRSRILSPGSLIRLRRQPHQSPQTGQDVPVRQRKPGDGRVTKKPSCGFGSVYRISREFYDLSWPRTLDFQDCHDILQCLFLSGLSGRRLPITAPCLPAAFCPPAYIVVRGPSRQRQMNNPRGFCRSCGINIFCSIEIIQETLTLSGALPPPLRHPPVAMTTYYLQPDPGHRYAPRPPPGDWWRKRGASCSKKSFLQSSLFAREAASLSLRYSSHFSAEVHIPVTRSGTPAIRPSPLA